MDKITAYGIKRCISIIKYGDDLFRDVEGFINKWHLVEFVGTDENEHGTYFMFQSPNAWYDFKKVGNQYRLVDYGLCSDWSDLE